MYTNMLKFLADVVRHLSSKTCRKYRDSVLLRYHLNKVPAEKFFSSILAPNVLQDSRLELIKDAQSNIEMYSRQVSQMRQNQSDVKLQYITKSLETLQSPVVRIESSALDASRILTAIEAEYILDWISQIQYQKAFEQGRDKILISTGHWLLRRQEYKDWHSSSVSQLIWLHGVPGSGKSTLLSVIQCGSLPRATICLQSKDQSC